MSCVGWRRSEEDKSVRLRLQTKQNFEDIVEKD